jgi:GNAT superfamily N-acetyltransferase
MIEIVRAGAERIEDLEPLWAALNEHHAAIAPEFEEIGPVRSREDSWRVRRAIYEDHFGHDQHAFVLIAEDDGTPVAYALVVTRAGEEAWTSGERIGVLETLSVLPSHRGQGLGTRLVETVFGQLRAAGITEFEVETLIANEGSRRFYERFGLRPFTTSYLGRIPEAR